MGVHEIKSQTDFESAIKDHSLVILDCYAVWCGPCKAISPQVDKFSDKYTSIHFIKIDVDEVPDVAQELGIRAMPTFLFYKDGEKVKEVVGANPKAILDVITAWTA